MAYRNGCKGKEVEAAVKVYNLTLEYSVLIAKITMYVTNRMYCVYVRVFAFVWHQLLALTPVYTISNACVSFAFDSCTTNYICLHNMHCYFCKVSETAGLLYIDYKCMR